MTASMAKYWTTELQNKLVDRGVQMHGGYGYMLEYPIARAWVNSRVADDLRRHHRDPEGDHRPVAGALTSNRSARAVTFARHIGSFVVQARLPSER